MASNRLRVAVADWGHMTTAPAAIIARLTRLVLATARSADEAERELAAAMADLTAAHLREAALAAELIEARGRIGDRSRSR